jgi:hypothetical protein
VLSIEVLVSCGPDKPKERGPTQYPLERPGWLWGSAHSRDDRASSGEPERLQSPPLRARPDSDTRRAVLASC